MEPGQIEGYGRTDYALVGMFSHYAGTEFLGSMEVEPRPAASLGNKKVKAGVLDQSEKDSPANVFHCYVFKSRLQEYCQKAGLKTPVYDTIKQGPSHEPVFKSSVTVGDATYDSFPGFFNRKAAEQSAAEVALVELAKSGVLQEKSQPVQETGLCKNLLQEYAQKMNFAAPVYESHKDEKQIKPPMYHCTVEIGGMKYIGASAITKKEAEIKAARTALLAIQSASLLSQDQSVSSVYTVIPQKRKTTYPGLITQETAAALKTKKRKFKKFQRKKRCPKKQSSSTDALSSQAMTIDFPAEGISGGPIVNTTVTLDTPVGRGVGSAYDNGAVPVLAQETSCAGTMAATISI